MLQKCDLQPPFFLARATSYVSSLILWGYLCPLAPLLSPDPAGSSGLEQQKEAGNKIPKQHSQNEGGLPPKSLNELVLISTPLKKAPEIHLGESHPGNLPEGSKSLCGQFMCRHLKRTVRGSQCGNVIVLRSH